MVGMCEKLRYPTRTTYILPELQISYQHYRYPTSGGLGPVQVGYQWVMAKNRLVGYQLVITHLVHRYPTSKGLGPDSTGRISVGYGVDPTGRTSVGYNPVSPPISYQQRVRTRQCK